MNRTLLFFFTVLVSINSSAQNNVLSGTNKYLRDSVGLVYSTLLSPDSISKTLFILASEELEGRETGQRGQKEASIILSRSYYSMGLLGKGNEITDSDFAFIQKHTMSKRSNKGRNLASNGENFVYGKDFIYLAVDSDTSLFINNVVFIASPEENIYNVIASDRYSSKNFMLFDREDMNETLRDISEKKPRPDAVFIITDEQQIDARFAGRIKSEPLPFYTFYITEDVAVQLIEKDVFEKLKKKGRKKSVIKEEELELSVGLVTNTDVLCGENVIAVLQGSDPNHDAIVISSHYDHLGKKDSLIYFGADDNASGTSAVVELARIFSKAAQEGFAPLRDIVFMNVSGEEKGLLGSSYFVDHPTIPIESIVANLNIDMIGRTDSIHDSTGVSDYIYIIGADRLSTELHNINEEQNKRSVNLQLDYTYNLPDDPNNFYRRSDHYNFAKKGIPVCFYFDGKHVDYHKPSDVPEKIDLRLLTKRARLVFLTAWELANREKRIIVDKK